MKSFAQQLKYERALRGWSQEQLAALVGTTALTISRWEHDVSHPKLKYRQGLSELFGKTAEELGLLDLPIEGDLQPPDPAGASQPLPVSAQQLKYERTCRSWSQEQLAKRLGTTRTTVSLWERGLAFPTPYFRQQLSALFEQSLETLGLLVAFPDPGAPLPTPAEAPPNPPASAPGTIPFCWQLPSQRNPLFTGREGILTRLHCALYYDQSSAWPQVSAITGLGGMGKTQLALEYAYRFAESYQSILWLGAETSELLWADLAVLAEALHPGVREDQSSRACIEAVQRWLQEHCDWLLIVDNLEDLGLLREFLPPTHRGHILVTTRVQATGSAIAGLALEKMTPEEGALFLLRRSKRLGVADPLDQASLPDRRLAASLVDLLDGLPLAIDQAGAYIEEAACSLAHYVALFQSHQAVLLGLRTLSGEIPADHPRSVRTTLALSLERLQREHPAAMALLQLCAFLHPEAIPEELLLEEAPDLSPLLRSLAGDPLQLDATIAHLRRYSLLQRHPDAQTLSLHRLVQVVVQDTLVKTSQREWAERVVRLVQRAFPQRVEYATWERCQRLLPHALACARLIEQWDCTFPEATHLLSTVGNYLQERGAYGEAQPLLERALSLREQTLGPVHLDVAASLNSLALLYLDQGRYEQAQSLLERALALREQVLEPMHVDVAESLCNLAVTTYLLGRYAQALPLYQRTLSIDEQRLGPDHPDVASDLNNLAELYGALGQHDQAVALHQRALAIREQTLGPTHPEVATSLNNLAILYRDLAKYKAALSCFERALTIREQVLGSTHQLVAESLHSLATYYRVQGQYEAALPLFQRALSIDEQALGPVHPEVATDLISLALLYRDLGKDEEAVMLFERALRIREQALGPNHPKVASCLEQYAALLHALQQPAQAEALEARAYAIYASNCSPA